MTLIAAYDKKMAIGKEGKIPWTIPQDRSRFKALCRGKKIIMGRKSFMEIGHALPYCTIIVVSKTLKKVPAGCLLADCFEKAVELCGGDAIVAGGAELYKKALPFAKKLYATEINADFSGDVFFPEFDKSQFIRKVEEVFQSPYDFEFVCYELKE